jgi:hypothetical protein
VAAGGWPPQATSPNEIAVAVIAVAEIAVAAIASR